MGFLRSLPLASLLLLTLSLPAAAGVGVWTPLGPDGGDVRALAVDPAAPEVVYAGTPGGVFKSADGGESWAASSQGLPAGAWARAILVRPGAVFLGTQDGIVYRSTDAGASWARSSKGISPAFPELGPGIGSLSSDPRRPNRIWAGARKGLFSSIDNGATWATRYQGPPFDNPVTGIAIDPANGQIYIASYLRGVYTSTNEGKRWTKVSKGLLGGTYSDLVLDPRNRSILHVAAGAGLWRSDNRGGSWQRVAAVNGSVAALVYQGNRLYAASLAAGLFYSDDQGRTWTANREAPEDRRVVELAAGPLALYAGTEGDGAPSGVYRSLDRGDTWEASYRGLDSLAVHAVAVSPADANVLYAYAEGEGLFKSVDRGGSWELLRSLDARGRPPIQTLLVDRTNPAIVYAGSGLGPGTLLRSTDAGATWEPAAEHLFLGVEDLESDPGAAGTVWAAGYSKLSEGTALYRSVDHGVEWEPVDFPGGDEAWIRAFEVDPTSSQVLWAAGGLFEARPQGVRLHLRIQRSADGGLTWQRRDSGIDLPPGATVVDLAIAPGDPNRLYAATMFGLYRTTDAGLTWTPVPGFPGSGALEVETAAAAPATVYAWFAGFGAQRSTDGGLTWTAIPAGLETTPLLDLAVDPTNPRRLYAGSAARGVLTYEESP